MTFPSDICSLDIGPGIGLSGGTNKPYDVQLADNIYSCRGFCLQDKLCVFVGYQQEEGTCQVFGNDFALSLIEPRDDSFLFHKKCLHGEKLMFIKQIFFYLWQLLLGTRYDWEHILK